jgi:hypothetical protein
MMPPMPPGGGMPGMPPMPMPPGGMPGMPPMHGMPPFMPMPGMPGRSRLSSTILEKDNRIMTNKLQTCVGQS